MASVAGPPKVKDGYARAGALGILTGGMGPGMAVVLTNPADVAKVRLQMQKELGKGERMYRGPVDCLVKTGRSEGIRGVQRGLPFCIVRDSSKGLFRLGLNDPIIYAWHGSPTEFGPVPVWKQMVAGFIAGAVAAIVCNPFDLVKTRLQASGGLTTAHYKVDSGREGFQQIIKESGVKGLWQNSTINIWRSSTFMMACWPANHELKRFFSRNGIKDGILKDFISSFGGSAFGILFLNPCDVVRTRLYNQPRGADGKGLLYNGISDTVVKIVKTEGVLGMQKGLLANYMRVGPQTMLSLIFIGRIRQYLTDREQARVDAEWHASRPAQPVAVLA